MWMTLLVFGGRQKDSVSVVSSPPRSGVTLMGLWRFICTRTKPWNTSESGTWRVHSRDAFHHHFRFHGRFPVSQFPWFYSSAYSERKLLGVNGMGIFMGFRKPFQSSNQWCEDTEGNQKQETHQEMRQRTWNSLRCHLQPLLCTVPRKLPNSVKLCKIRAIMAFKVIQGHRL